MTTASSDSAADLDRPSRDPAAVTSDIGLSNRLDRVNMLRDALAGLMLVLAALLPWNIYVGTSVSGTRGWVLGLIVGATLVSLASVLASRFGPSGADTDTSPHRLNSLRRLSSIPYLLLVVGFLVFAVEQQIRLGGTTDVPPGLGPGVWFGAAGALIAAQPVIGTVGTYESPRTHRACRAVGIISLVLALLAVASTLYYRTRYVLSDAADSDISVQSIVVVVAAVLYGAVALLPILIGARWMISGNVANRLATVLLAISVLIASFLVWFLPVGREVDAFHGIAQATSTAGVGFEGYLAWCVVAAISGTPILSSAFGGRATRFWVDAGRKSLLLIAAWCGGSAALRIVDLATVSALDLPSQPYSDTALMACDLTTAVLAIWLMVNGTGEVAPKPLLSLLFGVLAVLTPCRAVLGVALVPRTEPLNPSAITDVYGNTLAQQITSTFDVAAAILAIALLVIAVRAGGRAVAQPTVTLTHAPPPAPDGATVRIYREPDATPAAPPATPPATPPADRVADVLAQSTRRFAAGTTYTGAARTPSDESSGADR
ncbi:MAG TPA: hypothetical protein PLD01_03410 [Mycobacterium sp.]|jgi:hypothetical protein|nr:hypothetical protein [Mycobacterium sp.]